MIKVNTIVCVCGRYGGCRCRVRQCFIASTITISIFGSGSGAYGRGMILMIKIGEIFDVLLHGFHVYAAIDAVDVVVSAGQNCARVIFSYS